MWKKMESTTTITKWIKKKKEKNSPKKTTHSFLPNIFSSLWTKHIQIYNTHTHTHMNIRHAQFMETRPVNSEKSVISLLSAGSLNRFFFIIIIIIHSFIHIIHSFFFLLWSVDWLVGSFVCSGCSFCCLPLSCHLASFIQWIAVAVSVSFQTSNAFSFKPSSSSWFI